MNRAILWGIEKNAGLNTIPEGLYVLALASREAGFETEIRLLPRAYVDTIKRRLPELRRTPPERWDGALGAFFDPLRRAASRPGLLAHGVALYEADLDYVVPLVRFLRASSAAPVIVGGPFPTLSPGGALAASGADALLAGECERTWPEFLRALAAAPAARRRRPDVDWRAADGIPGFARPDAAAPGGLRSRPFAYPEPIVLPRDDLEFWMSMRRLNLGARRARGDGTFFLSASRGCSRHCLFCSHANGRRVRCLPAARMRTRWDELRRTFRRWQREGRIGNVCLSFNDDDFLLARRPAEALLRHMALRRREPSLPVMMSVSVPAFFPGGQLDEALVRRVADAGVRVLNVGTDAFSAREIRQLKSAAYTPAMIEELVACFERHRLHNNHYWMLCGPRTRVSDIVDQILFARRLFATYRRFILIAANVFIIPYRGSRVREAFPPERHPGLYRERRFLPPPAAVDGRPAAGRFHDRVWPADPHARAVVARLARHMAPGPDGYDFESNLRRIERYVRRHMSGPEGRAVRRRLDAAGMVLPAGAGKDRP